MIVSTQRDIVSWCERQHPGGHGDKVAAILNGGPPLLVSHAVLDLPDGDQLIRALVRPCLSC